MRIAIVLAIAMLLALACEAKPAPTATPDREQLLRVRADETASAFSAQEWAKLYTMYPDDYRAKCPLTDFAGRLAFGMAFLGVGDGLDAVAENVRVEGDQGWFDLRLQLDGEDLNLGDDSGDPEPAFTWEDEKWVAYVSPEDRAKDNPCSLE